MGQCLRFEQVLDEHLPKSWGCSVVRRVRRLPRFHTLAKLKNGVLGSPVLHQGHAYCTMKVSFSADVSGGVRRIPFAVHQKLAGVPNASQALPWETAAELCAEVRDEDVRKDARS